MSDSEMAEGWHYIDWAGTRNGPLSRDELLNIYYSGKISESTIIWNSTTEKRQPLSTILSQYTDQPIKKKSRQTTTENTPRSAKGITAGATQHPWLRFLAKYADFAMAAPVSVALISAIKNSPDGASFQNPVSASLLVVLAWIPIEAAFLSTLGTTPGRWLLGLKITDINGNKLGFNTAIIRAFTLAFRGLAFGLPLVSLATLYFSYKRLKKEGNTYWDISTQSVVIYKNPGQLRSMLFGLLLVLCLAAMLS